MKAVGITENKGATNTKNAKAQILAGMDKVAEDVGVLQALPALHKIIQCNSGRAGNSGRADQLRKKEVGFGSVN